MKKVNSSKDILFILELTPVFQPVMGILFTGTPIKFYSKLLSFYRGKKFG